MQGQLLSTLEGPTQYSFKVPDGADAIDYGVLFLELKNKHDATLFGIAKSTLGDDLVLNARAGERIYPGMIVYFMSADRIEPEQIDWAELGHATGLGVIPTA